MSETVKLKRKEMSAKGKIIVAIDVERAEKAKEIISELREDVGAFKIGLQLFTSAGASFVRELVDDGIKVFLDVKFHDIPNTVSKAAVEVARLGVWMFNIHALGGAEMMLKTVKTVGEVCEQENLKRPKIIGVTVLTSANRKTLREVGIANEINSEVLTLAKLTAKCGLDGVVASAREVEAIRLQIPGSNFLIVTPGIRPEFATKNDQKRVMTPKEALAVGSDFLVIGRPIVGSKDRRLAVQKILEEIQTS